MERTNNVEEGDPGEKKIRWRKEGGGSFRLANGKIIKPGQSFNAFPSQIPMGVRDIVVALDKLPPTKEEEPVVVNAPEYSLDSRGGGWYNILDANGKKMNEKAMKREDALKHIETLVGE